jgi:hypothetical protein
MTMRTVEHKARYIPRRTLVILAGVCLLLVFTTGSSAFGSAALPIKMVVPMYSDPAAILPSIASDSSSVQMVILNPAVSQRFDYSSTLALLVQTAQAAGIKVLGYVPSDYDNGVVPLSYSETLMSDYSAWYHVNGFFIDEVNTTCLPAPLSYYTSVSQFARAQPGVDTVVMNLGGDAGSCYIGMANIFVTFENTYSAYLSASPPSWASGLPSSDFLNIIYDTPDATAMQNAITLALARNVGTIYVTDENGANPYAGLPSYMQQESAFLNSLTTSQAASAQSAPPPQSPLTTTTTTAQPPSITVESVNQGGQSISGYWAVLLDSSGNSLATGYTPGAFTGLTSAMTYEIELGSYHGCAFSHWQDTNSTTEPRMFTANGAQTVVGVYNCTSSASPAAPAVRAPDGASGRPATLAIALLVASSAIAMTAIGVFRKERE